MELIRSPLTSGMTPTLGPCRLGVPFSLNPPVRVWHLVPPKNPPKNQTVNRAVSWRANQLTQSESCRWFAELSLCLVSQKDCLRRCFSGEGSTIGHPICPMVLHHIHEWLEFYGKHVGKLFHSHGFLGVMYNHSLPKWLKGQGRVYPNV